MTATPQRRWYQFTLRGLMCLILVIGTALGWWNYRRNEQIRRQERIERAVILIGECPDWHGGDGPVPLIRAVNHLLSMGREDAIKALRRVEAQRQISRGHQSLGLVIPLLFGRIDPEDKLPEEKSRDGEYALELDDWDNRIDVEGDVPFLTLWTTANGPGWDNTYLVEWAERDGRIRTTPLRPTDDLIGAADKMIERLQQEKKDPDAKKWVAYLIREQVFATVKDVVSHELYQPVPWHTGGDEAWEELKKQCRAQNLRWSEQQQNYVATVAKTSAAQ